MHIEDLKNQFVAISGGTPPERTGMGLVMSFQEVKPHGIRANVYNLTTKALEVVAFDHLSWVPPKNIVTPDTVKGLIAQHPRFGHGEIIEAVQTGSTMMRVRLRSLKGDASDHFLLSDVVVLGPARLRLCAPGE